MLVTIVGVCVTVVEMIVLIAGRRGVGVNMTIVEAKEGADSLSLHESGCDDSDNY
jgi:hypothetical protein